MKGTSTCASPLGGPCSTCIKKFFLTPSRSLDCLCSAILPFQEISGKFPQKNHGLQYGACFKSTSSPWLDVCNKPPTAVSPLLACPLIVTHKLLARLEKLHMFELLLRVEGLFIPMSLSNSIPALQSCKLPHRISITSTRSVLWPHAELCLFPKLCAFV